MYELIRVSENTFYMDCPAKVGIVKITDKDVALIDSGSDKDAGKKVKKLLDAQGWCLKAVYNTHSHADHIGGNQYLQSQTGCKIYAAGIESCFTAYPILEPTLLYGGFALSELRNKFLMAKESFVEPLTDAVLPAGWERIALPGHSYDMVGFRTPDNVVFLADSLSSAETLEKYRIGYLYDVRSYLETLEKIETMQAAFFIPSHADVTSDIAPLAGLNIEKTKEVVGTVRALLCEPMTFDELLHGIFDRFGLSMTLQQNALIGSTVKSYLTYLKNEGGVDFRIENNRMLWQTVRI